MDVVTVWLSRHWKRSTLSGSPAGKHWIQVQAPDGLGSVVSEQIEINVQETCCGDCRARQPGYKSRRCRCGRANCLIFSARMSSRTDDAELPKVGKPQMTIRVTTRESILAGRCREQMRLSYRPPACFCPRSACESTPKISRPYFRSAGVGALHRRMVDLRYVLTANGGAWVTLRS